MRYRDIRLFLRSMGTTFLMGLLILAICIGLVWAITTHETGKPQLVRIAVSNQDTENAMGQMAIRMASSHELVKALLTIELCDSPEAARDAVRQGAAAAVILPDGFFDSIMTGEDLPCELVFSEANDPARNTVSVYADVGSDLLSAAQYAVYAGISCLRSEGVSEEEIADYIYELDLTSFDHASKAQKLYFVREEIPYTARGLPMVSHYIAVYLAFFLSMLILSFSRFFGADLRRDTLTRLRASGITIPGFLRWKLILPTVLFLVLSSGILTAAGAFAALHISFGSILCCTAGAAFCALSGSLLAIGLGSSGGGTLFVISAVGLFLCGGIVPYSKLSPITSSIGSFTPLGVVYSYFSPLLGGRFSWSAIPTAMLYLVLAGFLAIRRLQKSVMGRDAL